MLSEACIALGEHLASLLYSPTPGSLEKKDKQIVVSASKHQRENSSKSTSSISKDMLVALRRDALNAFADAAGYAARAEVYFIFLFLNNRLAIKIRTNQKDHL